MNSQDLTREIYVKYPNVWEKIIDGIDVFESDHLIILTYDSKIALEHNGGYDLHYEVIPFNILYALLEDFFQIFGIIINITYLESNNWNITLRTRIDENVRTTGYRIHGAKNEAKYQAILKACELLEPKL